MLRFSGVSGGFTAIALRSFQQKRGCQSGEQDNRGGSDGDASYGARGERGLRVLTRAWRQSGQAVVRTIVNGDAFRVYKDFGELCDGVVFNVELIEPVDVARNPDRNARPAGQGAQGIAPRNDADQDGVFITQGEHGAARVPRADGARRGLQIARADVVIREGGVVAQRRAVLNQVLGRDLLAQLGRDDRKVHKPLARVTREREAALDAVALRADEGPRGRQRGVGEHPHRARRGGARERDERDVVARVRDGAQDRDDGAVGAVGGRHEGGCARVDPAVGRGEHVAPGDERARAEPRRRAQEDHVLRGCERAAHDAGRGGEHDRAGSG